LRPHANRIIDNYLLNFTAFHNFTLLCPSESLKICSSLARLPTKDNGGTFNGRNNQGIDNEE
jgi:hypothetical protein